MWKNSDHHCKKETEENNRFWPCWHKIDTMHQADTAIQRSAYEIDDWSVNMVKQWGVMEEKVLVKRSIKVGMAFLFIVTFYRSKFYL